VIRTYNGTGQCLFNTSKENPSITGSCSINPEPEGLDKIITAVAFRG